MAGIGLVIDIAQEFGAAFGSKPYVIPGVSASPDTSEPYRGITQAAETRFTDRGSLIAEDLYGVEIFLPVKLYAGPLQVNLPYSVISIQREKIYVSTPLIERKGTVKELFSTDDYHIELKGFLIGRNQQFPENDLQQLRQLVDLNTDLILDNALTNIFLSDPKASAREQRRVVIKNFSLPEVSGGRKNVRPFAMKLLSDSVFNLEVQ